MRPQQIRVQTAVELAIAGATVLTANTRAARGLRAEAERQAWQQHTVCESPDILPVDAWVTRTWTDCLLAGVVDEAILSANVTAALWEKIVRESATGRGLMSQSATADLAEHAWTLLHKYKLPIGGRAYDATQETRAFHGWAREFESDCRKQKWIDSAAAFRVLIARCASIPHLPKQVVAFGFDSFTPLERELWTSLQLAGVELTLLRSDPNAPAEPARVIHSADAAAEIRCAALWARAKLEGMPSARIGIIVPGLRASRDQIESIFSSMLHPEHALLGHTHGERCFEISLGRPLAEHPMVRTALRVLRLATSELAAEEWSALLRSRYWGSGSSEATARASLDAALRNRLRVPVTLAQLPRIARANAKEIDLRTLAPNLFKILSQLERETGKLPKRMTRSEWAAEVRQLLPIIGWPGDAEGEFTLSSEEFQVSKKWNDLLASFGALDQVLAEASPKELQHELELAAREAEFALENQAAPIQVVGPLAASGESFDALWFCGLSDEVWPKRSRPNPFVPHAMQVAAGIPDCSAERSLEDARRVTGRLLGSADDCVLSWPKNDGERELQPSPLLKAYHGIALSELPQSAVAVWNILQDGAAIEEFEDAMAPAITNAELQKHGTSLLEWQSGCPFRGFALGRLVAEELDEASLGANPRDRGKITERTLELVWNDLRESHSLEALPRTYFEGVITKAIETALDENFPAGKEAWLLHHRDLERERLNKLIHEWLEFEKSRASFHDVKHQQEIKPKIGGLELRGRIDRIERTLDGSYVVIDYKTGSSQYSRKLWETPRPDAPQLPIYAVAQRAEGREIAGVAFAKIAVKECKFIGIAANQQTLAKSPNLKKDIEFKVMLESWRPELERLAADFLSGNAEVNPKRGPEQSKSTCERCHLGSLCRIAEFSVSNGEDEGDSDDD
ncbi:MAG TPA: PD-(D/E)XK nuclease family protein [Candidatus Koribacter sp.]|jgi:probable DNA repair protein